MRFSALATVALGAEVAIAARWTEKRRERHAARAASRQTNPLLPATEADGLQVEAFTNETAHVDYSSNWAGAVLIGTGYKSVTGTFVVPTPSKPSGGSSSTEVSEQSPTVRCGNPGVVGYDSVVTGRWSTRC